MEAVAGRRLAGLRARPFIKYAILGALLYVLSRGVLSEQLKPFGFGAYLALVFVGCNVLIMSPLYLAAAIAANPTIESLIGAASMTVVLTAAQGIRLARCRALKKKQRSGGAAPQSTLTLWQISLCAALGNVGYIYIIIATKQNLLAAVLSVLLGMAFMLCCVSVFGAIFRHKFKYKPDKTELAAAGILTAAVSLGLQSLQIDSISVAKVLGVLGLLSAVTATGAAYGIAFGLMWGLGGALFLGDISVVAAMGLYAVCAAIFCDYSRVLAAGAALIADVVAGYYFGAFYGYGAHEIIALCAGALLYLLVPMRAFRALEECLLGARDTYAIRHIINRNRSEVASRLKEVGRVFGEMQTSFTGMVRGVVGEEEIGGIFATELPDKLCVDCKSRDFCRSSAEIKTAMSELIGCALKKGRVTLLEMPPAIANRCCRSARLLQCVNEMVSEYLRYAQEANRLDAAKMLVSTQLGGIAEVVDALAQDTRQGVGFDLASERRIMEELTYADIIASEAIITRCGSFPTVTLIIKSETIRQEPLLKIADRVLRSKMRVSSIEDSAKAGFSVVTLTRAPLYDLVFGIASASKNNSESSGDTHSVTRISDERLMLALCDGMGSGKKAAQVSSTAIALVENFYKAGFDSNLILTSVNRLLTMALEETFSALDIVVVDLNTARCDFIKFGAPCGVIKHRFESEEVDGGALPMGVMEEVRPAVCTRMLNAFDSVVMATDGITDVFLEQNDYISFVNNIKTTNPQSLAAELVDYARSCDRDLPHDDMTCLAFRLIPRGEQ